MKLNQNKKFLLLIAFLSSSVSFVFAEEDIEKNNWQEIEIQFPVAPNTEKLQEFYVSAATKNRFFLDSETLSVDRDGVVRYVLVITTSGGAKNISYEGIRCSTKERKIYASGRRDGSWSKARNDAWKKINDEYANRHHAALFFDYFCPNGVIVQNTAELKNNLRQNGKTKTPW